MRRFIQDKGRTSAPQVWEVVAKGNAVTLTWGQLGGAMQKTTQTFEGVNVGKANEKSPKEVAAEWEERQILLRTRKGYVEVDLKNNLPLGGKVSASEIDFEKGLPPNLRFFKPQNSLNGHCEKLLRAKEARLLRKRDGMMHVISISDGGGMTLYSSTLQPYHKDEPGIPWLERYPHLAQEIASMNLPSGTVLLGELCTTAFAGFKDKYGMPVDDFEYVSTITKSLTPLALEKQAQRGPLGFCIWDIAFWEGECVLKEWTAYTRFSHLLDLLSSPHRRHLTMPEEASFTETGIRVVSLDTAEMTMDYVTDDLVKETLELAKTFGWEGWVVVDGDSKYEDKSHSFHGKAERPKFVCKLKPKMEADFIVRWDPDNGIGARGKGKKSVGVGAVVAYLWDPDKGEEVEICEIGGGLTDEDVKRFADPKLYPMCWQVEFDSWTPKGALRFPVFLRERDDKTPEECLISQRPTAEEEESDAA
jgi:predicted DNA-binding WGR domain protein